MDEVKEKIEVKKSRKRGVALVLTGIPGRVHEAMKAYQRKISAERGKKFTVKDAYVEFLKEKS